LADGAASLADRALLTGAATGFVGFAAGLAFLAFAEAGFAAALADCGFLAAALGAAFLITIKLSI
ncbi:MAG: hypothetical protein K1X39_12645, partial [Thermoflexales bacterium]|nr:hypothetical protein [Thermoflexales bacterium]